MGLTVRQAQSIQNPIITAYDRLEQLRVQAARVRADGAGKVWADDPRVLAMRDEIEKFSGLPWNTGFRCPANYFVEIMTSRWLEYEVGVLKGPMWDAFKDAGYEASATTYEPFYQLPISNAMTLALRTTKKDWGSIADPYSALIVAVTTAKTQKEIITACEEFLEALK